MNTRTLLCLLGAAALLAAGAARAEQTVTDAEVQALKAQIAKAGQSEKGAAAEPAAAQETKPTETGFVPLGAPVGDDGDAKDAKKDEAAKPKPKEGDHAPAGPEPVPGETSAEIKENEPQAPAGTSLVQHDNGHFRGDPTYESKPYDAQAQWDIYGAKKPVPPTRPPIELGRPLFAGGPLVKPGNLFGDTNPTIPHFMVYGDWRTAVAYNDNGAAEQGLAATRLNLDIDLKITGTERIHAFIEPLRRQNDFTTFKFSGEEPDDEFDLQLPDSVDDVFETGYFEGDLGSIVGGAKNSAAPFDCPIAGGLVPLIFHNGTWLNDAFWGFAVTPVYAQQSKHWGISNLEVTLFAGFDKVTNAGITEPGTGGEKQADHSSHIYGANVFMDALEGYWEVGYAYVQGTGKAGDLSHHSMAVSFTRRYFNMVSNSIRVIGSFGQDEEKQKRTADGFVVLLENSFISHKPLVLVPYVNAFFGYNKPQALARTTGGLLFNTGILFETDALTGYPQLNDTANNTFGAAVGAQYLFNLDQQVILELGYVGTWQAEDNDPKLAQKGDEFGVGFRYQIPIDKSWILRMDAMYAHRDNIQDLSGVRFEIRAKF